jgi:hypothetical protein
MVMPITTKINTDEWFYTNTGFLSLSVLFAEKDLPGWGRVPFGLWPAAFVGLRWFPVFAGMTGVAGDVDRGYPGKAGQGRWNVFAKS